MINIYYFCSRQQRCHNVTSLNKRYNNISDIEA